MRQKIGLKRIIEQIEFNEQYLKADPEGEHKTTYIANITMGKAAYKRMTGRTYVPKQSPKLYQDVSKGNHD